MCVLANGYVICNSIFEFVVSMYFSGNYYTNYNLFVSINLNLASSKEEPS